MWLMKAGPTADHMWHIIHQDIEEDRTTIYASFTEEQRDLSNSDT